MATATPPRSAGTTPPLQHNNGKVSSWPEKTLVEAPECFANGQYFDVPCTLGSEDSDARSNSAVSICSGDKSGERWCRAQSNRRWKASTSSDTGTRDEGAAYPAAVSSMSSYYFSGHNMLTGATHERAVEQGLMENRNGMNACRSFSSQASERTGDTAEQSSRPFGLLGAASPSVVQPVTRMARVRAAAVAASSRAMSSTELDDPYHVLFMPTAATLYSSSRAGSDRDSVDGESRFTARASQQDMYCMNTSILTMSTDAPASLSTRQQRDGAAPRGGSASVTSSCNRVYVPGILEYGEWMLTARPATMETLCGHSTGAKALATDHERRSARFPSPAAIDARVEPLIQSSPTTAVCFPRTAPPTTVSDELQAGPVVTAKAHSVPSARGSQLSRGAADSEASPETKDRPPVSVYKSTAAIAPPPPLSTSAIPGVCITMTDFTADVKSPARGVVNYSTAVDAAVCQPVESQSHRCSTGFAKAIAAGHRRRVSDCGAPFFEASLSLLAARNVLQHQQPCPSYANDATNSGESKMHTVPPVISNGFLGGHGSAFMTTASVSTSSAALVPDHAPLLASGVHPIRKGVGAPSCVPSSVASTASTATPRLLSPQALATAGQPTSTAWAAQPPDVSRRAGSHSPATTVGGATSSTASTLSGDLIPSSSPKSACAQSGALKPPSIGPQPLSNSNGDTLLILSGGVRKSTHPSQTALAARETSVSAAGGQSRSDAHVATSKLTAATPTASASTISTPAMSTLASSRGLSDEGGASHATEDTFCPASQTNKRAPHQLPKQRPLSSRVDGQTLRPVIPATITLSSPHGTAWKATRPQEEAHVDGAAASRDSRKDAVCPTRSPCDWRRRMGFKQNREIVLPDSKSLRASMSPLLEFRSLTMREQGKEMMPSTEEVSTHLVTRWNAVCVLVVVDEDAVRKPCLVVSGLSVRVYEEDKSVTLANSRMAHGMMRVLKRRGGATHSRFLCSASYDGDEDSDDSDALAVGIRGGVGLSNRATSSGGGGLPSNLKSYVLLPDKKVRRSQSGVGDSADPCTVEFDNYLHKFDVDETLSRLAGRKDCHSVTLDQLVQTWVTGHNTCLLLGNGNGRSTQSLDVVVGAVESAMSVLRERLTDPASRVELHISMGEVSDDNDNGGTMVLDLLTSSSDNDDDDSDDDEQDNGARWRRKEAPRASQKSGATRPPVQLARSPLLGTFVKGLRSVKIDDATTATDAIGRALTLGFMRRNMSTHSSRNNSMSTLSSLSSAALNKVCISFATLGLKTICRGADMRSARLSARESATSKKKFGGQERHSHSVEYRADVLVSSLLLVYFGTEHHVLDTLVQHSQAYRTTAREEEEGIVHPNAPLRAEKPDFHPASWPNAVGFLQSLLCDALGGRTRTMVCLCLSEYDSRATLWLRAVSRARRIINVTPNCGNMRNYLLYLLEQYDNLAALQSRRKQDARLFLPALGTQANSKHHKRSRLPVVSSNREFDQWSVYCIKKMIAELDAFLATSTGDTPLLERLEIANEIIATTQSDSLSNPPLAFFSRNS
ncbi:hypothetical protein, unknown function [Leishmania mexicana MHOM/GT/2001/U1103]|uniref:Uncharacterized protein n=1 Tax=Leishmania mexicana (strain MHOM/GT/2001/U1103) TaxID=929439 RepID=E9B4D8_LEIMU|nr:hypothetical protein, unknown function [Leishmania mexicana MHOM/GT/2001/U1103]CBZ30106.1 hypothetical protein, unknown function [Leishmania mexicana MHOM/GT/2001/U1103]